MPSEHRPLRCRLFGHRMQDTHSPHLLGIAGVVGLYANNVLVFPWACRRRGCTHEHHRISVLPAREVESFRQPHNTSPERP